MLSNIRVVLVRTYHPGNIGSAARAMKTMGLSDLYLVEPKDFESQEAKDEATKMATGADDIVLNARQVDSLFYAIKECTVVVASTARTRGYDLPLLNPEQCAEKLYNASTKDKVALVLGPERMGLSNDDLALCKYRVTIPTNPDYSSLNLAAAVQTLAYEIYKYSLENEHAEKIIYPEMKPLPDVKNMEKLYVHLEETLHETGFIIKNHPGEIMQKLRAIYDRAELDESELNIMRGILSSVSRYSGNNEK